MLGQDNNRRNVLCIGPAGEKLCRIAGGSGAVMGSKNLKAIVVAGSYKNRPNDRDAFRFILYETGKLIKSNPMTSQALPDFGTDVVMNVVNYFGALPTRNFQESQFENAEEISGEQLTETLLVRKQACWACPIACTRVTKTSRGEGEGPEYETVWAFGAQCGISDLEIITEASYLCNELGLDTISTGNTIGCAMEMGERGLLETDLEFGCGDLILNIIHDIAHRHGLGDDLAEGSYRFAEKLGAEELSMSVKRMEIPAYDPRGMQGQGLLFATSNRGACHMRGNMLGPEILGLPRLIDRFATQGKAGIVATHQNSAAVIDSLGVCKFVNMAIGEEYLGRQLSSVTGISFTSDDLMRVGERVWNIERLYNLREGFTRDDDTLPTRLLTEAVTEGPSAGKVVNLTPMLEEYYKFRGWSGEGVPNQVKLEDLGLNSIPQVLQEATDD
jgi:aldehyde:ferredoxin oxidoreductase